MIANGVVADLPLDVAMDVCEVLLATGRAAPAAPWVERLRRESEAEKSAALPHRRI